MLSCFFLSLFVSGRVRVRRSFQMFLMQIAKFMLKGKCFEPFLMARWLVFHIFSGASAMVAVDGECM